MQNKKGIILIILVCVCVLGVSIAAWYILNKNNNNNHKNNNNNPYGGRDGLYNDSINYELDTINELKEGLGFGGRRFQQD